MSAEETEQGIRHVPSVAVVTRFVRRHRRRHRHKIRGKRLQRRHQLFTGPQAGPRKWRPPVERAGAEVETIKADVSSDADCRMMAEMVAKRWGSARALVTTRADQVR